MKKLHTLLMAACAAAFFAGCGDNATTPNNVAKAAAKGAKAADAVKMTGNAVADYKAVLDKLADLAPRIYAYSQSQSESKTKTPSLSQIEDSVQWSKLMGQLVEAWKQAKPDEREQLKKHAETVLEKLEDGEERSVLLGVLMVTHMAE
jgi:PBP1b-binding outer membrane lipoprotein LpoB